MTERELDHLLSTTPGAEVTVDASVNPPHGQITKVTYTRAQVAALIAKVAPRMTEPTMSAETEKRIEALAYCGHSWEDETALGVTRSHRQSTPSYTGKCQECANRAQSHWAAFADGQARGRAETSEIKQLRAYLDAQTITSQNIGEVRRTLFLPWESAWNGIVRDETASRENAVASLRARDRT